MQLTLAGFFEWLSSLGGLQIPVIAMFIPIIGIIVGGITALVKIRINHTERMAMIRRGIHPDAYKEGEEDKKDSC